LVAAGVVGALGAWAAVEHSWAAALILGMLSAALALPLLRECAWAMAIMGQAVGNVLDLDG
jgi:hypothetical protein